MNTAQMVRRKLESLPPDAQQEVLDFVEFLAGRRQNENARWSAFALTTALAGIERDEWPEYRDEDFSERWL